MSLSKPSEQSPLLGQQDQVQTVPANGKPHDDGDGRHPHPMSSPDEQPSNAKLAVIMGSIWVRNAGNVQQGA